jgi:hypothetical protein
MRNCDNCDNCVSIRDHRLYVITIHALPLPRFHDLKRCFGGVLSEPGIFETWIRNRRLAGSSGSSNYFIIALLARAIGREITFQKAPGPCLEVFAILPDLLSLTASSEPAEHLNL